MISSFQRGEWNFHDQGSRRDRPSRQSPPQCRGAAYRLVLVEIVTDSGLTGVGEVGLAYGVGATGAMQVASEIARNYVIGSDAAMCRASGNGSTGMRLASRRRPGDTSARSARSIRRSGTSRQGLGAPVRIARRRRARPYSPLLQRLVAQHGSPEALGERARREAELGLQHSESGTPSNTLPMASARISSARWPVIHRLGIERVQAVSRGVGPDVDIILEFHGNLMPLCRCHGAAPTCRSSVRCSSRSQSIARIRGPSRGQCQQDGIPVATGERIYTNSGLPPYLESGALSVIQPDMGLCGEISEAMKIAASARPIR